MSGTAVSFIIAAISFAIVIGLCLSLPTLKGEEFDLRLAYFTLEWASILWIYASITLEDKDK